VIDPKFTSPQERRDFWPILRVLFLGAVIVLGGRFLYFNVPLPFVKQAEYLAGKQADNDEVMLFYRKAVEDHREWAGTYPASLVDSVSPTSVPRGIAKGIPLRDAWGHPVRYYSDGTIYLLVSVGRDGEPETEDYHLMRSRAAARDICSEPDADVVVSDRGWHARCNPHLADRSDTISRRSP
jgi:hypothetical protein